MKSEEIIRTLPGSRGMRHSRLLVLKHCWLYRQRPGLPSWHTHTHAAVPSTSCLGSGVASRPRAWAPVCQAVCQPGLLSAKLSANLGSAAAKLSANLGSCLPSPVSTLYPGLLSAKSSSLHQPVRRQRHQIAQRPW